MRSEVSLGLSLECLPAGFGTEVIGLALVNELINRGDRADLHATDRILVAAFVSLPFHFYLL